MVHQHFMLVPAFTVAENIALGLPRAIGSQPLRARIDAVGAKTGFRLDPDALVATLSVGEQQQLEILKALVRDVSLLILDEPTAVLAPGAARELLQWIRSFAQGGRSAVLITHKLDEALAIADDVTVLRKGIDVLHATASEVDRATLIQAMLGEAPAEPPAPIQEPTPGRPVVTAQDLCITDSRGSPRVKGVSLELRAGELVGLAAVEGSGQRELLRAIAGRLQPHAGRLSLPARIGFVPEDRHSEAIIEEFTIVENVALHDLASQRGWMRWAQHRASAEAIISAFEVRAPSIDTPMGALSGGNQQRFVFGREAHMTPDLLVCENPTRGLDVRAAASIHRRLRLCTQQGAAVVIYSSDLDDLLSLADRILVMYDGSLVQVPRDRDVAGRAMLGVA
jgi:simple sugar transport system ATP-binding protein